MDYLAGILEIIAKIIVGRKCKWGWLVHLVSGLMWTFIALHTHIYGLLVITIPAFIINIYNFIDWYRKDKNA